MGVKTADVGRTGVVAAPACVPPVAEGGRAERGVAADGRAEGGVAAWEVLLAAETTLPTCAIACTDNESQARVRPRQMAASGKS